MTVRFIGPKDIEQKSLLFLQVHHPALSLPIPVDEIVEFCLQLDIKPAKGLRERLRVDGYLQLDRTAIVVDHDEMVNCELRYRFTLAHEIGHFVLHQSYLECLNLRSEADWRDYILANKEDHHKLEVQANIFAGFLLMPTQHLAYIFSEMKRSLISRNPQLKNVTDQELAQYFARPMAKEFKVSEEACLIRLERWIATGPQTSMQ